MLFSLRIFFSIVLASMLAVTSWASFQCPLFSVPREVATHPWFIATLFDAYWGFLTFFTWVAYKQTSWFARGTWLIAILLLGNIAMASYALAQLFSISGDDDGPRQVLTRRDAKIGWLGPTLAVIGVAVVTLAARS